MQRTQQTHFEVRHDSGLKHVISVDNIAGFKTPSMSCTWSYSHHISSHQCLEPELWTNLLLSYYQGICHNKFSQSRASNHCEFIVKSRILRSDINGWINDLHDAGNCNDDDLHQRLYF